MGEGYIDIRPVLHALRTGRHVVDGEGPARPVGDVGRGVVHGLAVVEHGAARGQVDHRRLLRFGLFAQVEEGAGLGGPFVGDQEPVRPGDQVHGPVRHVHVVQGEPAAHQVGGSALPVVVVLVPEDGTALPGRLEERLVVEKLDVGPEQGLDDVQDGSVVEQFPELDAALAHLHDLQHLRPGFALPVLVFRVIDGEVAVPAAFARGLEYAVVLIPKRCDVVVVQQFAGHQEPLVLERANLLDSQPAMGFRLCLGHGRVLSSGCAWKGKIALATGEDLSVLWIIQDLM